MKMIFNLQWAEYNINTYLSVGCVQYMASCGWYVVGGIQVKMVDVI